LLQAPPISPEEIESRLGWLASVLAMDIQANREAATRLDLGLSNFGLDAEGRLYYLDDDFYSADDGWVAMAQTLGIYFRQYQWIDADFAAELGKHLRDTLLAHFPDPHCLAVLAGQLRGLFMPNEGRQTALQALVEALATGRTARAKPLPSSATHSARPRYFALLADVHANLPALEAALAFLDKENIRDGLVLGDVVGYGPHPVECIQRLQDLPGFALLQGNHDHAAATGICGQGFGNTARWCIEWTTPRLSAADKAWLLALPVSLQGEGWLAVHGAPVDPTFFNAYVYHMSYAQNLDVLEQRGIDLCFHGHTHMPGVYARNKAGADGFSGGQEMSLDLNRHSLVCPGSVGQPRNRETGSQLAVLDWQTRQLRFFNLPYAVDCVVADMEQADFPPGLSQRLLAGL
jgi:predicted phosphodiesterase